MEVCGRAPHAPELSQVGPTVSQPPLISQNRPQAIHRHLLVPVATLASVARRLWPQWTTLTAVADSLRRTSFDLTLAESSFEQKEAVATAETVAEAAAAVDAIYV